MVRPPPKVVFGHTNLPSVKESIMDNHSIRGGSPTTDSKSLPWGQRQVTVDEGILWISGLGWLAFFAHVIFTASNGGV